MDKVTLTIDSKPITSDQGRTILEAALNNGIYIPHLCSHEGLAPAGACGMCAVKVNGRNGVVMACRERVSEGMEVDTRNDLAEKIRKLSCDLIFKTHPSECTGCPKYGKCQLQTISQYVGDTGRKLRENKLVIAADDKNPIILHEMHRCILCGRCVRVCTNVRGVGAIRFEKVKSRMRVIVDGNSLADAGCRYCSACVDVCPTGSIREHEAIAAKMEGKPRENALVPCREACPAHIDVPRYVRFISLGDYNAAASVVREKAPFPYVLGYICTHPCEAECKRNYINTPVNIRNLKRFAAFREDKPQNDSLCPTPTGKRIAVIGAGPAGLTAAWLLVCKGHETTVYEARSQAGGMLRYGVPKHRLPREVLNDEISFILSAGVTLETNIKIENAPVLLDCGFDAVLVAVGAHRAARLPLPGADLVGVYFNTDFLSAVETGTAPDFSGRRVVILGGGNVALDCAAVARRLGACEVRIACLEAYEMMTSTVEELTFAREEGIIILNSRTFLEITGENGFVTGIKLVSISGFSFDEAGKSLIDTIPGSEEIIGTDAVVFAIGQRPDIDAGFGLRLNRGGRVEVTEEHITDIPGVFAAGDVVTGTISVIQAIAGARSVASAIDAYLGGDGVIDLQGDRAQERNPYLGKVEGFGQLKRNESDILALPKRINSFVAMDLGLNSDQTKCEAGRCLQCDLRLDIAPQRFWTDYMDNQHTLVPEKTTAMNGT